MRFLIIRPPGHFSSLVYPDGPWVGVPLSLMYVAAAARRLPDVEVSLLDALAYPDFDTIEESPPPVLFGLTQEEIVRRARAFAPDVIGLSVAAETFYDDALETIATLREAFPEAFIVAGGTDVAMQAERYLDEAPGLDAIAIGEGERAVEGLLAALRDEGAWRETPGLAWRGDDGEVHRNPIAYIDAPDDYLPRWDEVDLEQYFRLNREGYPSRQSIDYPGSDRAVYLVSSRGCPYRCSFCSIQTTMGHKFRTHGAQSFVAQVVHLAREHGVNHFHFEDDNLSLDAGRLREILTGLRDAALDITWDTPNGVRADRFDDELVSLCLETGCVYLMFGVESGSQAVLDEIVHKELKLKDVEKTLALCNARGIDTMGLYIFGLPGEDKESVRHTYQYAFRLFGQYGTVPFFSIYKPYPGTALYARCEENGWLIDARPYERMGKIPYMLFMPTMVETPQLDIWFIVDLYQRYMIRFAAGVFRRAFRVFFWQPHRVLYLTLQLLWRMLRRPAKFMPTARAFFWRTLLFPRAKLRSMRR